MPSRRRGQLGLQRFSIPSGRATHRVETTTVPDLPLEDAGWEDDEHHPRTASELTEAFERTWAMIEECLRRWTADDLEVEFRRTRPGGRVKTWTARRSSGT